MRRGLLALSLAVGVVSCGGGPPSAASPVLSKRVSFALPSHDGKLVSVPVEQARVTIVDAFAPTCEPCREKVPALLAKREALVADGALIVMVAVLADGESTEDAMAALRDWGAETGFLVDRGDRLATDLAIDKLPGTVVLDASGTVRWVAPADASANEVAAAARAIAHD